RSNVLPTQVFGPKAAPKPQVETDPLENAGDEIVVIAAAKALARTDLPKAVEAIPLLAREDQPCPDVPAPAAAGQLRR
ncbi:MAG: hypothetical protein ABI373_01035, partial [Flavobacteriales bacterium]